MTASIADLNDGVQALLGRRDLSQVEYANWLGGPVDGGPNKDGYYPLTDSTGFVRLVAGLSKIATLTGLTGDQLATLMLADANARNALIEANRKTTVFRQGTAPESPGYADLWANGTASLSWFDGTQWLPIGGGGGAGGGGLLASGAISLQSPLYGSSAFAWQQIGDPITFGTATTPAGKIELKLGAIQSYDSNAAASIGQYGLRVLLDNVAFPQANPAGLFANEMPSITGDKAVDGGTAHTLVAQWRAAKPGMSLVSADFSFKLFATS